MNDQLALDERYKRSVDVSHWLATLSVSMLAWLVLNIRPMSLIRDSHGNWLHGLTLYHGVWVLLLLLGALGGLAYSVWSSISFRIQLTQGAQESGYPKLHRQVHCLCVGAVLVAMVAVTGGEKGGQQLTTVFHIISTVRLDGSALPHAIPLQLSSGDADLLKGLTLGVNKKDIGDLKEAVKDIKVTFTSSVKLDPALPSQISLVGAPQGINLVPPTNPIPAALAPADISQVKKIIREITAGQQEIVASVHGVESSVSALNTSTNRVRASVDKVAQSVEKLEPVRQARGERNVP